MAHAIGCIGSSMNLATKPRMTAEQRAKNNSLAFPRSKLRNQKRRIAAVEIRRPGEPVKYRLIRDGHLHHYRDAYWYADVRYLTTADGKKVTISRK